eukprot:c23515_g1_i1 orf=292-1332(-)
MGAPKQKWTPEEEAALRAGVEKYGPGKWRAIQKDQELGPCLSTRSNVDLKDKWRNMNVGSSGHGSREKSLKSLTWHGSGKATDEPIAAVPLASLPGDHSAEDTHGGADALVPLDSSSDRKSLGLRYKNLILEAILGLKDPNGSSTAAIASYIEDHVPVPSNFKRLLSSKLRDLTIQGRLIKIRQNYKVNDFEHPQSKIEPPVPPERENRHSPIVNGNAARQLQGAVKTMDQNQLGGNDGQLTTIHVKNSVMRRGEHPSKKVRMDVDIAKPKLKASEEAARAAAWAVAEAEAAATAAEQAAKEAEAAQAEAEAAEIAAEIVALAAKPQKSRKVHATEFIMEDMAIVV